MQFYKPHPWFVDRLAEIAGTRLVIEVGCGEGHLLRMLRERGVEAYGIELLPLWDVYGEDPLLMGRVIPGDVTTCEALVKAKDALIIVARPCHGEFFQKVLEAVDESCDVLYIGLRRNLKRDGANVLAPVMVRPVADGDEICELRPMDMPPVESDENHVVRCRPSKALRKSMFKGSDSDELRYTDLYLFSLIRNERNGEMRWAESGLKYRYRSDEIEFVFLNGSGGYSRKLDYEIIGSTVLARGEKWLDRRETTEYKMFMDGGPDCDAGWIDRDGHTWKCRYHEHIRMLWVLFGMSEEGAEGNGWIKIHVSGYDNKRRFFSFRGENHGVWMTPEQVCALRAEGFDVDEDGNTIY